MFRGAEWPLDSHHDAELQRANLPRTTRASLLTLNNRSYLISEFKGFLAFKSHLKTPSNKYTKILPGTASHLYIHFRFTRPPRRVTFLISLGLRSTYYETTRYFKY